MSASTRIIFGIMSARLCKIQRHLCTPLNAVTYTNEFLVVSGAVGSLMVLLLASFSGSIETMSGVIGDINTQRQNALYEKIDILSSESVASRTKAVIILSNYGKHDTVLLSFFSDPGIVISCTSNNAEATDMTITAGGLLEVTCVIPPSASRVLILTDTRNILEAGL